MSFFMGTKFPAYLKRLDYSTLTIIETDLSGRRVTCFPRDPWFALPYPAEEIVYIFVLVVLRTSICAPFNWLLSFPSSAPTIK